MQDVRAVRGMGRGLSDPYVVLCKVRLVGACIKRREVVAGTMRIRSEKLREYKYSILYIYIAQYMLGLLGGKE